MRNFCCRCEWAALALLCWTAVLAAGTVEVSFARGVWNEKDFIPVDSPRFHPGGSMLQREDHIVNRTPDAPPEELMRRRYAETYAALVYREPIRGNADIRVRLAFDYSMAPSVVVAPELGRAASGRAEFREHVEVCLFDGGINVWHHTMRDTGPHWRKLAYLKAKFRPGTIHELRLTLRRTRKGVMLNVRCGDREFGCALPDLGPRYYAGIIGSEGVTRFYSFSIRQ